MNILIADDDPIGRTMLTAHLERLGFDVTEAADGIAAWEILEASREPRVAVLDWMMPGLDGVEICRRLAAREGGPLVYVVILTGRDQQADLLEALSAGADDYVTKPFDPQELAARIRVGARVVTLHRSLEARVRQLEETLETVRELRSLLPMCAYCRQIRDDQDYWHSIEEYFARHAEIRFSHGVCPSCETELLSTMGDGRTGTDEGETRGGNGVGDPTAAGRATLPGVRPPTDPPAAGTGSPADV